MLKLDSHAENAWDFLTWIKPGLQNKRTTRKGNQAIAASAIKNSCWGYTDTQAHRYSPLWQTKPSSLPEGGRELRPLPRVLCLIRF